MKKNFFIGLLTIMTVLSIVYGYYQKESADENYQLASEMKIRAEKAESLANEMKNIAEENAKQAYEQMKMAQTAMLEAEKQREIALQECQKSKEMK